MRRQTLVALQLVSSILSKRKWTERHSWVQNFTTPVMICQGSTTASPSCGWCRWNQDCGAAVHCCPVSRWFCMILLQFQWFFEHLWTAFSDFAAIPTPRSLPPSAGAAASQQCGGTARYKHRWLLSRIQKKTEIFWAFWSLSQCGWAGMSMNNLWTMLKPWPSNPCSLWVRKVNEPILLAFSRYPMVGLDLHISITIGCTECGVGCRSDLTLHLEGVDGPADYKDSHDSNTKNGGLIDPHHTDHSSFLQALGGYHNIS